MRYYIPLRGKQDMEKKLLISILCLISIAAFAQIAKETNDEQAKLEKLKGTFNIVTTHRLYDVPSNLSEIIEKNRLKDKDTSFVISNGVTLVVFALDKVKTIEKNATK